MSGSISIKNSALRDAATFAIGPLSLQVHPWQAFILNQVSSIGIRRKIAVRAPNGAGKDDRIVVPLALWWLRRFSQGQVVITSKDAKQLQNQTWRSLTGHKVHFNDCRWLDSEYRVISPTGGQIFGFTTDESARAEGYHRIADLKGPLLMIVNEAKSVPDEIFDAFERCTYNVLLEISTGGLKQGRFYEHFTKMRDLYECHEISLHDCPHIPKEKIDDTIKQYGEHHPFTRSTLYGEFMDSDDQHRHVFDLADIESNRNSSIDYIAGTCVVGCDFAAGGDENVLCVRKGNKIDAIIHWREKDTMSAVGRFIWEFSQRHLKPEWIWGDGSGVGITMCDRLAEAGWPINRFNFGGAALNPAYKNAGSFAWHETASLIKTNRIIFPRDIECRDQLISQLTARFSKFDSSGKLWMETKEEMFRRGLKSPDLADAFCMCFGVTPIQSTSWIEQEDRFAEIAQRHGWAYKDSSYSEHGRRKEEVVSVSDVGWGSW